MGKTNNNREVIRTISLPLARTATITIRDSGVSVLITSSCPGLGANCEWLPREEIQKAIKGGETHIHLCCGQTISIRNFDITQ